MSEYKQLGYIGLAAFDSAAWRTLFGEYLGMQVVDVNAHNLALRMDDKRQRILIEPAQNDGLACLGLETVGLEELEATATFQTE